MIKAAFFDIDGTLLSHKSKSVPASTRRAVEQLRARGIKCIIATGRQLDALPHLPVADMVFDGYIFLNGQMTLDTDKNLVRAVPITGKAKEYLVKCFREHTFPAMMVEANRSYVNFANDHVTGLHSAISTPVPPLGEYEGADIYQVCAYMNREEEGILAPILDDCVASRWHFGGLDLVAKGGGKDAGIRACIEGLGVQPEEVIAFGDAENDIGMLTMAGIGVAMGNGTEATKAAADYVTDDIDADGIAKALIHFGLIEG